MTRTDEATDEEIVLECEMEASPEKLWRALTERPLLEEWLGAEPAEEGAQGPLGPSYRIVDAEPYTRLSYAWHDPEHPEAPPLVTIELEPLPGGHTWFRLTHGAAVAIASRPAAANANQPLLTLAA